MQSSCPFPPGSQVAAYLRDSGGPNQDLSVPHQQSALLKFAEENNIIITRVFADLARTGTTTVGRDKFLEMVNYLQQKTPRPPEAGLILWSYSRFARDVTDSDYYEALLERDGYEIYSISDYIPQGLDEADTYLFKKLNKYSNAKFIITLRANTKSGLHGSFRDNDVIGGRPPRGFKREVIDLGPRKKNKTERHLAGKWVPDPDLWDICKKAWQMRAAGSSYPEIHEATHLYKSLGCYSSFFSHRIYLGEMNYGGEENLTYAPPMIDQATWDKVQQINHHHRIKNDPRSGNPDHSGRLSSPYLLSGLAFCSCGAMMNGYRIKSEKTGNEKDYDYYRCSEWHHHSKKHIGNIPQKEFEDQFINFVIENIFNRRSLMLLMAHIDEDQQNRKRAFKASRTQLQKTISKRSREIRNLTAVLSQSGYLKSTVDTIRELEKEVFRCGEELHQAEIEYAREYRKLSLEETGQLSDYLIDRIKNAEVAEKRHLLRGFISRIDVQREDRNIKIALDYVNPVLVFSVDGSAPIETRTRVIALKGLCPNR
jgi:site-specific DNA recombinase